MTMFQATARSLISTNCFVLFRLLSPMRFTVCNPLVSIKKIVQSICFIAMSCRIVWDPSFNPRIAGFFRFSALKLSYLEVKQTIQLLFLEFESLEPRLNQLCPRRLCASFQYLVDIRILIHLKIIKQHHKANTLIKVPKLTPLL